MGKFFDFYYSRKIIVEVPANLTVINESTKCTVGNYTAYRHPPHTGSEKEYHGICELPGGYEISWTKSGSRRHEGKFPSHIPKDARKAVANVLNVSPTILEGFRVVENGQEFLLIEIKEH